MHQGRLTMAWVPIMGRTHSFQLLLLPHTGVDTAQPTFAGSTEVWRCLGLWIVAGDFNTEPEIFGQCATPARLPGVLVKPAAPTFRHGAPVRCFDYFVVHCAMACHIRDPVQMKLRRSFRGWSQGCRRPRERCHHPSLAAHVNLGVGTANSRRKWTIGGRGSCKAPSRKSWGAATSLEQRRRPTWAEAVLRDG